MKTVMTLAEIKTEIERLPDAEREKLFADFGFVEYSQDGFSKQEIAEIEAAFTRSEKAIEQGRVFTIEQVRENLRK